MRGVRGHRPEFRGGHRGQNRGRRGNFPPRRNNLRGGRRFGAESGHQNYRPAFHNAPEAHIPIFEPELMEPGDHLAHERRLEKEPLRHMEPIPASEMDEGVLTEEDGEIKDDPPAEALLPTPPGVRHKEPLLPLPGSITRRPPGPPPGPPPEGAKPFVPIGLTHQGQRMLHRSGHPGNEEVVMPEQHGHIGPDSSNTVEQEARREPELIQDPPRRVEIVRDREVNVRRPEPEMGVKAKDENGVPVFLLCPLCKDLLLKPLVLPCFHAICGERCIPKLVDEGFNVWCPTCRQLKATKCGIPSLKPAETFGKMSRQIRDEKRLEAIEKGEVPEHCMIEEYEDREFHRESKADGLTCPECNKIYTLPLRLPCSHSICKFPCAYKMLKHNVKIVCSICEKPNYCNEGVKGLPVDDSLVEQIKAIKGDNFVEEFEQKLRDIAEGKDLQRRKPEGEPVNEEELNKYRYQKVKSAEQRSKSIPSLLSLDAQFSPEVKPPFLQKPPAQLGPPPQGPQGIPKPELIEGPPIGPPPGAYLEDKVSQELRRIRTDQGSEELAVQEEGIPLHDRSGPGPNRPEFERPTAVIKPRGHLVHEPPPGVQAEEAEKSDEAAEGDEYIVEELPPELAAMADAWAGPKRCRQPKKTESQKKGVKQVPANRGNHADRFKKYEKSRERNKFMDDSVPPGVEVFEYENRSHPLPPGAPSLLDLDVMPSKLPPRLPRGPRDMKEPLPPLEELYPELADDLLLRRPFPRGRPPYPDLLDDLELDALLGPRLGRPPPHRMPPPVDLRPLGPDGLPPKGVPGVGPPIRPMGPPRPVDGVPPPPPGVENTEAHKPVVRPSVPGLNVTLNPVHTTIPSMIYGSGSGPPPIVNYGTPSATEPVSTPAPVQPGPTLPEPGQLQAAPATLPVMDPSTIPTMSSAFEYQAHWTKFVQQTQAYYNNLYAAQGGTPAEAQETINDYLAKCWAWYSAYTNLCLVNPEYKDMGKESKKEKKLKKEKQAKAENSGGETEEQSGKKDAKNKKKKKNKTKGKASEAQGKAEGIEEKELEELKIMLLKKQLELKVKHARNKSELRGLMNMKKLILEEEGEEKVEEIDEEEREKVKEAAKQKQLEREQEIERQERERAKDREKEIQRLEQERIREREKERQKERQKEREMRKKEMEEKARKEKQREREYHDREYDKYRARRGDDSYRRKKRKRYSRSRSKSKSNSRSRSRSYSSRSRSRSPVTDHRKRPVKEVHRDETKDEEPKYIKVANLPDELKAVELKSFVEAFGRVLNCKIGKMQGEMMAVVQMASLADAMSCVRDMHGSQFKSKILEVKYMGNKPNLKSVEVSIPDVYSGPSTSGDKPKVMQQFGKPLSGPNYGFDQEYYGKPAEIRHIWIGNLPWGTTEEEIMRFVYHHGTPLDCRIGTNSDPSQRGLYAIVTMESYIDVLKCINSLHGIRFEGRTLDVKKMKY